MAPGRAGFALQWIPSRLQSTGPWLSAEEEHKSLAAHLQDVLTESLVTVTG